MKDSLEAYETVAATKIIGRFQNRIEFFNKCTIQGDLELNEADFMCNEVSFKNVSFNGNLSFDGCNIRNGIKFINCHFSQSVQFKSCLTKKDNFHFLAKDISIIFVGCTINGKLIIQGGNFEGGFSFYESSIDSILFHQVTSNGHFILRNQNIINDAIRIFNCRFPQGDFSLNESTFKGTVHLENNKIGSCSFAFSEFQSRIFIERSSCDSITLNQCRFAYEFILKLVKAERKISIIECSFKKIFRIELDEKKPSQPTIFYGFVNELFISNTVFENVFSLMNFSKISSVIKKVDLVFQNINGSLHFDNLSIEEINFSGYNLTSRVVLADVNVNNLSFKNFRNVGCIDFINLQPFNKNSCLKIDKSILGYSTFVNCQLHKFQKYIIKDAIVDKVISSGTKWFDNRQINTNITYSPRKNHKELKYLKLFFSQKRDLLRKLAKAKANQLYHTREIFRQLKVAMDSQGNRIQGLFFQSQEFIVYEKELKLTQPFFSSERLILCSNKSNSHGQNFKKPIGLALLFTLAIFLFLVNSITPELAWVWPWHTDFVWTWELYWAQKNHILELLNPTFSLNEIFPGQEVNFTFCTYFWATLQRISISFFIFQTVSAFRKYIK